MADVNKSVQRVEHFTCKTLSFIVNEQQNDYTRKNDHINCVSGFAILGISSSNIEKSNVC